MKLYTRTGDAGSTSLFGGERRSKADLRVATYGEVDELQAVLGVVLATLPESLKQARDLLETLQHDGFILSAQLARPLTKEKDPVITQERIDWLEQQIDQLDATLPPLRSFIRQGGSVPGAHLHLARAVCRRAERALTDLMEDEEIAPECLSYLNRLSDFLFILARSVNQQLGAPEGTLKYL